MSKKQSILTTAMLIADAKKNADGSKVYEVSQIPEFQDEDKKFKKKAWLSAIGGAAVMIAAIVISNKVDDKKAAKNGTEII